MIKLQLINNRFFSSDQVKKFLMCYLPRCYNFAPGSFVYCSVSWVSVGSAAIGSKVKLRSTDWLLTYKTSS